MRSVGRDRPPGLREGGCNVYARRLESGNTIKVSRSGLKSQRHEKIKGRDETAVVAGCKVDVRVECYTRESEVKYGTVQAVQSVVE